MATTSPTIIVSGDRSSSSSSPAITPIPNNAILDPARKLFRLRKSSGGTIAKGAFGFHISFELLAASSSSSTTTSTVVATTSGNGEQDVVAASSNPPQAQQQGQQQNEEKTSTSNPDLEEDENMDKEEKEKAEDSATDQTTRDAKAKTGNPTHKTQRPTIVSEWYLFIEEAIYLHERGLLDVHDETERKMESYDLYQLLPQHGMAWPIYLVYAHLRQQTFKVVRYSQERRKIIQEQIVYLQQEKEEKEQRQKQKQQLQEQQEQQQSPPSKQEKRQKRRPNFGMQLRNSAAQARPPPWDDLARHLAWDVYPPDATFQKREPGLPSFSVLVTSHASPYPVDRVRTLVLENDPVPIKVASVADTGTVILFGVTNIGAPSLVVPSSSSTTVSGTTPVAPATTLAGSPEEKRGDGDS